MIDVNRVRHSLVLWGPSILTAWYRNPDRLRGPAVWCGLVTVRCLLPCPLTHWVLSRLFNFFFLLFFHPGRRIQARPGSDTLADGPRHTRTSQSPVNIHSARAPATFSEESCDCSSRNKCQGSVQLPSKGRPTACLEISVSFDLFIRIPKTGTARAATWNSSNIRFPPPAILVPRSREPAARRPRGASDMIRCDGGMSNDFSKRNGPCICARLQALPARLLVRRFVASGLPFLPSHTYSLQARACRESFLNSLHPAGSTPNGLAHHACIGISIS